jgi:DNA processing protein
LDETVVIDASAAAAKSGELEPWFRLRAVEGVGDRTALELLQTWGSPEAVFRASAAELVHRGCSRRLAEAIRRGPDADARRRIDRELAALHNIPIEIRTIIDPSYPPRLRMIPDPPLLLYVSGTLREDDELAVAIVGARRATPAGRAMTGELAGELAAAGCTIVSGLARGIDAAAHRGALDAGGRTIAVLGCGIDQTYPPEHERLRREIEERGAVVSEVPLWTPPHRAYFPRRNRIISGLSFGVVVTEAASSSGSLITARAACEQGREVFAVPGFVKAETSRGTNALIKEGAQLVERAQDVIDSLAPQLEPALRARLKRPVPEQSAAETFGNLERLVYDAASHEPRTVDELVEATGLPVPKVMAALLSLELRRRLKQVPGQRYLRL